MPPLINNMPTINPHIRTKAGSHASPTAHTRCIEIKRLKTSIIQQGPRRYLNSEIKNRIA